MPANSKSLWYALYSGILLLSSALNGFAQDASSIRAPLQNTGSDQDCGGVAVASFSPSGSFFNVRGTNLSPSVTYRLSIGGKTYGSVAADSRGIVRFAFSSPKTTTSRTLNFDPRGKEVAIVADSGAVLGTVFSGPNENPVSSVSERVTLRRSSPGGAIATGQYSLANGQRSFSINLQNVTGTNWWLYVDGQPRSAFRVAQGSGRAKFHTQPRTAGERMLDFDPRGKGIDIFKGTNLVFSSVFEAQVRNINIASPSVKPGAIPPTGIDPDGVAHGRFRVKRDATRDFRLQLQDVPVGAYDLLVNGQFQGSINVVANETGSEGEIEFSSSTDDLDKVSLSFDPITATFQVIREGVTYFQGKWSASIPGLAGNTAPVFVDEMLSSSGFDSDASGHADFEIRDDGRRRFGVEIEDIPAGTYELWIGGTQIAQFQAQLFEGQVVGEVEFSNGGDDWDELPLTFDPRGKLISVRSGGSVYFSHLFGLGTASGNASAPLEILLPLFSTGASSSGHARMEFKRDDRARREFEIEIEDVPLGTYSIIVGNSLRGSVQVIAVVGGTRGQIEFDDETDAGELPLTFDPLGQVISIQRDGVTWFERLLPSP